MKSAKVKSSETFTPEAQYVLPPWSAGPRQGPYLCDHHKPWYRCCTPPAPRAIAVVRRQLFADLYVAVVISVDGHVAGDFITLLKGDQPLNLMESVKTEKVASMKSVRCGQSSLSGRSR